MYIKLKNNHTEGCKSKLINEWRKRVGEGRIKQKVVKIFGSCENFAEGKKKKASYADSVFKKAASHATLSFLLCINKCEMKNMQPLLIFFADNSCLLSVYVLVCETNFPYKREHSIAHSIFKTCGHFFKRMKPVYILDIEHTVNFEWKISPIASGDWV